MFDVSASCIPVLPGLKGGAGPEPRHQGAAQAPPQADGVVQEAEGGLHPPLSRLPGGEGGQAGSDRGGEEDNGPMVAA